MKRKLIVGNWKMHNTVGESQALVAALQQELGDFNLAEVVLAPSFVALRELAQQGPFALAAQDLHHAGSGAFTGEVSGAQLRDAGCTYVIVGHSERRALFGETLASTKLKVAAAFVADLVPILCVGETLAERDAGHTQSIVQTQLLAAIEGLSAAQLQALVVAYEPVWAIGTGRVATPEQVQEVHGFLRGLVKTSRLLYGGSVKPDNAAALLRLADVDGALVGGASLDARAFAQIVRAVPAQGSYEGWFDKQF